MPIIAIWCTGAGRHAHHDCKNHERRVLRVLHHGAEADDRQRPHQTERLRGTLADHLHHDGDEDRQQDERGLHGRAFPRLPGACAGRRTPPASRAPARPPRARARSRTGMGGCRSFSENQTWLVPGADRARPRPVAVLRHRLRLQFELLDELFEEAGIVDPVFHLDDVVGFQYRQPASRRNARSGSGSTRRLKSMVIRTAPGTGRAQARRAVVGQLHQRLEPPEEHAPMEPISGPLGIGLGACQMFELGDRDNRPPFGEQPIRPEFPFKEHDGAGGPVAANPEFASAGTIHADEIRRSCRIRNTRLDVAY